MAVFYSSTSQPNFDDIPAVEYFKSLREHELVSYRYTLRAMLMHSSPDSVPSLPKLQERILEDLRENFSISAERHAIELEMARADPVVVAVRNSGVVGRREDFGDGVPEVPISQYELDADDDGSRLLTPSTTSHRRPQSTAVKGAPKRAQPPPPPAAAGKGNAGGADVRRVVKEKIDALGLKIREVASQLIHTPPGNEAATLRMQLTVLSGELDQLAKSSL